MFIAASLLVFSSLGATPEAMPTLPVQVTGTWTITVGPGAVTLDGKTFTVSEAVPLTIAAPVRASVKDEAYTALPIFNPNTAGWCKGVRLKPLIAEECSATGALIPESLRIKGAAGAATACKPDADYAIDPFWATFGRVEGGSIAADQTVYADYDYELSRLDSVVADGSGHVRILQGAPAPALALPPAPGPGETALMNIFVPAGCRSLSEESLFPIETTFQTLAGSGAEAGQFLPKTLAKLQQGQPVTIVAFGDSVTNGGGVGDRTALWYQNVFASCLQRRFPASKVTMLTGAWGGSNSRNFMDAPAGGPHNFQRDVLDPKPDLVTVEFVNDAYLDEEATQIHYKEILGKLQGGGAEVILITPHLVRPDWMAMPTLKYDEDPRPYVKGLRRFAKENNVALADASALWCRLHWRGLPYTTLLANAINHPDERGHALFADALMALFPGNCLADIDI